MKNISVIMAGGAGTRLWPLSSDERPKQFLNLSGNGTLLGETISRMLPFSPDRVVIVTAKRYESLSAYELKNLSVTGTVLCEPVPRNTAAAVLYAALYLESAYGDAMMTVLPADHFIKDSAEFERIIKSAVHAAESGALVTIGVKPGYPETGYGYIKSGENTGDGVFKVERFVEKPDVKLAEEYIRSGGYYWNSGIFVWKVSSIINEFQKQLPGHLDAFAELRRMKSGLIETDSIDIWNIKTAVFNSIPSLSIDNAILEKSSSALVIPAEFGWADLGSWKAVDDMLPPDSSNNRTPDPDRAVFHKSENCSVFTEDSRVSIIGLEGVTVVQSGREILVVRKEVSQDVKAAAEIARKGYIKI